MANQLVVDDPRWAFLDAARPHIAAAFADAAVTRVEFIAAFPDVHAFEVWLVTDTDAERDRLRGDDRPVSVSRAALLEAGFPDDELDFKIVVESQETVDRECDGSWFLAMR